MNNNVGMDVHKKNIVVAESRKLGQRKFVGEYENTDSGLRYYTNTSEVTK